MAGVTQGIAVAVSTSRKQYHVEVRKIDVALTRNTSVFIDI